MLRCLDACRPVIRDFLLAPGFNEERDTEGDAKRGEADTQVHGAPIPPQDVRVVQPAAVDVHLNRAGEADGEGDAVVDDGVHQAGRDSLVTPGHRVG